MTDKILTIEEVIAKLQEIAKEHPGILVFQSSDIMDEVAVYDIKYISETSKDGIVLID